MSRHDIANYLGLAAETVSRLFKRLKESKIASVNGRTIIVHDFDALRDGIDGCAGSLPERNLA
jgi:CRP/FNR family transcriptional regulator